MQRGIGRTPVQRLPTQSMWLMAPRVFLKDSMAEVLNRAVQTVLNGGTRYSGEVAGLLKNHFKAGPT